MKVKALKRGTWPRTTERQKGEVFDYDGPTHKEVGGKKVAYFPSWMEKLEQPKAEKARNVEFGDSSPKA